MLSPRARLSFLLIGVSGFLLTQAACVTRTPFTCTSSAQCDVGGAAGTCEPNGFCSLDDPLCDSGRRYAEDSPEGLAGQCVGGEDPGADADLDAPVGPDGAPDSSVPDAGIPDAGEPDAQILATYTPSNFPAARLTAGGGTLRIRASDGVVVIDTVAGTVTAGDGSDLLPAAAAFLPVTQGSLPSIGVLSVEAVEIEAGAQVRLKGANAFALAVGKDVHIAGTIDLRGGTAGGGASLFVSGAGGFVGGKAGAPQGGGPCGGTAVDAVGDVGGGGGGNVAAGGPGGMRGSATPGQGGGVCGEADLAPLHGGSGGGAGGGGATRGVGGGGGGAFQISARGEIVIAVGGAINAGGSGGGGGGNDDGGGGGGAGGAVLLEGLRIQIDGVVAANGGAGGAGANVAVPGANGQAGGLGANRALAGPRSGEGAAGGAGGAGGPATAGGQAGENAQGISSDDNAGGGGGAAGRLRLRSDSIVHTGTLSPSAGLTEVPL